MEFFENEQCLKSCFQQSNIFLSQSKAVYLFCCLSAASIFQIAALLYFLVDEKTLSILLATKLSFSAIISKGLYCSHPKLVLQSLILNQKHKVLVRVKTI